MKLRFFLCGLILWGVELVVLPALPLVGMAVDPLFLFLIFLSFRLRSVRFLWLYGAGIGFLKDLAAAGLFGAFTLSFCGVGWVLGVSRHLLEREDPLIQGIWTGLLAGVNAAAYGVLVTAADRSVDWNLWGWAVIPLVMAVNGGLAVWGFPRLQRIVNG
ncbi:MAG: hypothetical protein HYZ93_05460 [Candidatus Omnitrophica bacterium]|nr:hypothetical protein [Candidatus Omnitrophota bacterium]